MYIYAYNNKIKVLKLSTLKHILSTLFLWDCAEKSSSQKNSWNLNIYRKHHDSLFTSIQHQRSYSFRIFFIKFSQTWWGSVTDSSEISYHVNSSSWISNMLRHTKFLNKSNVIEKSKWQNDKIVKVTIKATLHIHQATWNW